MVKDKALDGRGFDRGNKVGVGPIGKCVCYKCGYRFSHVHGKRCLDISCPKCGAKMVRE